jgi:hypothetical protein
VKGVNEDSESITGNFSVIWRTFHSPTKNVCYSFTNCTYTVKIFIPVLLSLFACITCFLFHDVGESKWIYGGDFYGYSKRRVGKHVKGIVLNLYEAHSEMYLYLGTLNKRHDEPRWNRRPRPDCKNIKIRNTKQKLNWTASFMTRILNVPPSNFRCCTWYLLGGGRHFFNFSLLGEQSRHAAKYSSLSSAKIQTACGLKPSWLISCQTVVLSQKSICTHVTSIFIKTVYVTVLRATVNPLTPELNPSAQRCVTRFLLGILLLEPCISLIYA